MNLNGMGLAEELGRLCEDIWSGDINGIVLFSTRLAQRASLATEDEQRQMAMLAGQASHRAFSALWKSQERSWNYSCDESAHAFAALRSMEDPFHAKWIDSALTLMAEDACSAARVLKTTKEARLRQQGAAVPTERSSGEIDSIILRKTRSALRIHCLGSAGSSYGPDVERALGSMILALEPYKREEEQWSAFLHKIWGKEFGAKAELAEQDVLQQLVELARKPMATSPSSVPRRRG